jgi:hypothetical protein
MTHVRGARSRNRTGTPLQAGDFKSPVSTSFTIRAARADFSTPVVDIASFATAAATAPCPCLCPPDPIGGLCQAQLPTHRPLAPSIALCELSNSCVESILSAFRKFEQSTTSASAAIENDRGRIALHAAGRRTQSARSMHTFPAPINEIAAGMSATGLH